MSDDKPVSLDNARALKAMGAPLDTKIEERIFSKDYSKHWFAMLKAHDVFCGALHDLATSGGSRKKWRVTKHRLLDFAKVEKKAWQFAVSPDGDQTEKALLLGVLMKRVYPFITGWDTKLTEMWNGTPVTIRAEDVMLFEEGAI